MEAIREEMTSKQLRAALNDAGIVLPIRPKARICELRNHLFTFMKSVWQPPKGQEMWVSDEDEIS
jgi:hypothetical protein